MILNAEGNEYSDLYLGESRMPCTHITINPQHFCQAKNFEICQNGVFLCENCPLTLFENASYVYVLGIVAVCLCLLLLLLLNDFIILLI